MPASAIANVAVDAIVPSSEVASTIAAMVRGEDPPPRGGSDDPDHARPEGDQVTLVCPDCGGVLTEQTEVGTLQWECRVGHRFSPETLIDLQADDVEGALWAAVRAPADRAALLERMARQTEERGQARSARLFRRRAQAAAEQAEIVRQTLGRAAGTALRKVSDDDEDERRRAEEGAA
jgi:two-component system, chemotaxis family, protein-glutamate methylesterase/glutaminase